jgi:hypothetical protein
MGFFREFFRSVGNGVKNFGTPVPEMPGKIIAREISLRTDQLRRLQQYGSDICRKEDILGVFKELSEEGFLRKLNKGEEPTIYSSNDKNRISVNGDNFNFSITGIKRGALALVIVGEEIPVPRSDPHYLKEMIPREILRVEEGLVSGKIGFSYTGILQPTPQELIDRGMGNGRVSLCQKL